MQRKRTRWSETSAAKNAAAEAENRRPPKNYIKIEALVEVPFTIVSVNFEPSDFEGTDEQVVIDLTLDGDNDTEDEGLIYTLTTTRNSVMRRMRDVDIDDLPIGPVTFYETGRDRRFNTIYYSIGEVVEELVDTPVARVQRAIVESRKSQPQPQPRRNR